MTKGVFVTKLSPTYDDVPEERYHFPHTYLNKVKQTVGDFILYYEPRRQGSDLSGRGGRSAYFAAARVSHIEPDDRRPEHYYAYVDDYLDFDRPVPFREGGHYWERALVKPDGSTNKGQFGRAVRVLPDEEYFAILAAGMSPTLAIGESHIGLGLADEQVPFDRPIVEVLLNRRLRDQAFARHVRNAYNATCAFTGLRLINGGGRSEIEAAHIRPVGDGHNGPDSVRNGLALSRTMHWMFDRGLLSLEDDGRMLLVKRSGDEMLERVRRMLNPEGFAMLPDTSQLRPHPQFLRYHREQIFKG